MFGHLFNFQSKTVTLAVVILTSSALTSRFLGLIRDRLLASRFGAGETLDIYFAAFRIPDFIYGILIMGGVSAVFLPVFSEYFHKNQDEAWRFTSNVINCFLVLLIIFCGILAIMTPWLINLIVPGFNLEQKSLTVQLTRIMFLSPIFFGLSSIFSGVLHYFNRFLAYSLAPILYNIGIIFGIIFLLPIFGITGLAYGVILGAFFHWLIQVPAAKMSGFRYFPVLNFKFPGLVKIFKMMVPRTIGAAAFYLNLMVMTAIASTLTAGSVAIFSFADNLQSFATGIIGASFALAVFPFLSRAWVNGAKDEFLENFSSTFRQIIFLVIPISILFFLLRAQIVRLILGAGNFSWADTRLTAAALGLFSLGIFATALIPFLVRVFYSFQNTRTPALIGLASVGLNISLSFAFIWLLSFQNFFQATAIKILKLQDIGNIAVVGLPLAISSAGIVQFFLLLIFLRQKIGHIRLKEIWQSFQKIIPASALMAISIYSTIQITANFVNMQTFSGVFIQFLTASAAGILSYILTALLLKSAELRIIKLSFLNKYGS